MARFRLFDLNPAQHEAVVTTEGPVLILAGAGTGKTRVITARIAYMMAQGIPANHVLAVTFTNKAATEMRERVAGMVEREQAKALTISTFHSLCVRILRSGIDKLGYKKNFTIFDESDQLGLIRKVIARTSAKDEKLDPYAAKSAISKAKNQNWNVRPDTNTLAGAVYAKYQEELKSMNVVDFDDLLILAVQLLSEHQDVCDEWQSKFHYQMIDEFQDTNRLQMELVSLLSGQRMNVCVVGDDDQSIYGWRGAEISNILDFESIFPNPKVVKLEQNYRSTNHILGAANSVIRNNPKRRPKQLWSEHGDGERVRLMAIPDGRQEAEFVVNEIATRNASGPAEFPWESFAILFRTNDQSRLMEENLRRLRIPYHIIGGRSFYDRREIKDLLAYLRCLQNPDDDISLLRIVNVPPRGIGATTIENAVEYSNRSGKSLFATLRSEEFLVTVRGKTRGLIEQFTTFLDEYETRTCAIMADHAAVVTALIEDIDYFTDLRKNCTTDEDFDSRRNNVMEMISSLAEHQKRSNDGLQGFLDEITLDQERQEEEQEKNARGVTLITLHAAKGLEYPHVYLVGVEHGLIPHERSQIEGRVDEERRLFYVGITRAMRSLCMTYALGRFRYGSVMPCHPSGFLKELEEAHIERIDYHKLMSEPVSQETAKAGFSALKAMLRGG